MKNLKRLSFTFAIVASLFFLIENKTFAQGVVPEKGTPGCQNNLLMCIDDLDTCDTDLTGCQAATCGNGIAEFGEECDGENLQGGTCASEDFTYGKLGCDSSCEYDTSGCSNDRFVDNGDGTVTDRMLCVMWEKKTEDGGIHDAANEYTWTESGGGAIQPADGTVFTDFLFKLNHTCEGEGGFVCASDVDCTVECGFAGYMDWQLPQVAKEGYTAELETIRDENSCGDNFCIDEGIFGPVNDGLSWWSSITDITDFVFLAYGVSYKNSLNMVVIAGVPKSIPLYARAVRHCACD